MVLEGFVKFFHTSLNAPMWAPPRVGGTPRDSLVNGLNSQGETKININGKSYQILSYTLHFKPHSLQSLQMGSWENWQKLEKGENSYQSQLSLISVVSH